MKFTIWPDAVHSKRNKQTSTFSKYGNKNIRYQQIIGRIKHCLCTNIIQKIIILVSILLTAAIYIYCTSYLFNTDIYTYPPHSNSNDYSWITFGSYVAMPSFYTKKGSALKVDESLLSLATICDIDILDDAKNIISNYKSGPISIAVYIDSDYRRHSNSSHIKLNALFDGLFDNVQYIKYDIIIGILYINTSSLFWRKREFFPSTPMIFKFPTNSLRNLAEYQVTTDWLFNIDIDFWYFANSLNNDISSILNEINSYITNPEYGEKTIFIVPSFEVLKENKNEYKTLTKIQLLDLIENDDEIAPFHEGYDAQQCTKYNKWYKAEEIYEIDYHHYNDNCSYYYEPWYIMKTEISQNKLYKFNNKYIGRGLNKVERVFSLRHYCFNFIVLHNLFIIHSLSTHYKPNIPQKTKEKWHKYNLDLFRKQQKSYYIVPNSCSFNYKDDTWCKTGKKSKKTNKHCQVCCHILCDQCIECKQHEIHEMDSKCCIQSILQSDSYCNQTHPPCKLTLTNYCPSNILGIF